MEIQLLISWREDYGQLIVEEQQTGCRSEMPKFILFFIFALEKGIPVKLIYLLDLRTNTDAKSKNVSLVR